MSLNFLGIEDNPMYALLMSAATAGPPAGEAGPRPRRRHPVGPRVDGAARGRDSVSADRRDARGGRTGGRRLSGRRRRRPQHGAQGGWHRISRSHVADRQPGSPMCTSPDEMLCRGRGYEIPGFGLLPFGHNRFDARQPHRLPARADSADARHHRIRLDGRQCRGPDDARRTARQRAAACSASTCPSSRRSGPGPHALRRHRRAEQPTGRPLPRRPGAPGRRCRARALRRWAVPV